jgi:hypothetical protein
VSAWLRAIASGLQPTGSHQNTNRICQWTSQLPQWTNQLYQSTNHHRLKRHLLRHHNHAPPLPDTNSHCTRQQEATSISTTLEHQTNTSSIDLWIHPESTTKISNPQLSNMLPTPETLPPDSWSQLPMLLMKVE